MVRYIPTLGFCCMLLWGSTACVPLPHEPEVLSEHGYRVSLHVSDTLIFLGASGLSVPQASAVVVRVRDAVLPQVSCCRSCGIIQHPLPEKIQLHPAIPAALDQLQAVDVAFDWPG